jgi:CheY-like chemotaxis protein
MKRAPTGSQKSRQIRQKLATTKVLNVEHDDDNLYMLKTRLERRGGFEVLAAEDSERGCKLAVTEHPDVILMDLEMPVMDRWEPVRTLKKDPRTRNIPIIGVSARPLGACWQSPNRCYTDEVIAATHYVSSWQILLQKSFCTRHQNLFWLYARFSCKDVGDLIA